MKEGVKRLWYTGEYWKSVEHKDWGGYKHCHWVQVKFSPMVEDCSFAVCPKIKIESMCHEMFEYHPQDIDEFGDHFPN